MRYSLASHFRGTFVGICLGEIIPFDSREKRTKEVSHCQLIALGAMGLMGQCKLDSNHWQTLPKEDLTNSYRLLLATLPVALFFHDNRIKLRKNLLDLLQAWQVEATWRDITLAFAYAVTQSVTQKLHPATAVNQIVSFIGETSTVLPKKILKLNYLLKQRAGLARVKTELGEIESASSMMAMIFYCCLSTLEDFSLTIRRSHQISNFSNFSNLSSIPTLVAVLSGAYNSTLGIPVSWQSQLSSPKLPQRQLSEFSQMLKLADILLAHWSGLYELNSHRTNIAEGGVAIDENLITLQAIAAPDIIR